MFCFFFFFNLKIFFFERWLVKLGVLVLLLPQRSQTQRLLLRLQPPAAKGTQLGGRRKTKKQRKNQLNIIAGGGSHQKNKKQNRNIENEKEKKWKSGRTEKRRKVSVGGPEAMGDGSSATGGNRGLTGAGSNSNNNTSGSSNKPQWLQQYDLIGKIGEGTYGLVFLARTKSPANRGKSIAIKKFKQSKDGDGVSPTAIREIMVSSSYLSMFMKFSKSLKLFYQKRRKV